MPRLFVGLRPPSPVRDALLDAMEGIENARWQDDDQLHVTLRFVGEVDERTADDLVDALAAIRLERFSSAIEGTGFFERKGVPSAVWARVLPSDALSRLQRRIERACRSVDLEAEGAQVPSSRDGGAAQPVERSHRAIPGANCDTEGRPVVERTVRPVRKSPHRLRVGV